MDQPREKTGQFGEKTGTPPEAGSTLKPAKFAPADTDGLKPYRVEGRTWGREVTRLVYAASASEARYNSGLRGTGSYATSVKRATPADVEELARS